MSINPDDHSDARREDAIDGLSSEGFRKEFPYSNGRVIASHRGGRKSITWRTLLSLLRRGRHRTKRSS